MAASLGSSSQGATPFTPEWLLAEGTLLRDLLLASVALALGNISVLGVKPFAFLTQWGHDLQAKASEAFAQSVSATDTANDATAATHTHTTQIDGLFEQLQELFGQTSKTAEKLENLRKQINADPGENGGNDPCTDVTKVVNVGGGTVQSSIYGWWFSPNDPASYLYADDPATDRHGVGQILTSKQSGTVRMEVCCNTAKTNGCAVQVVSKQWAKDEVSIGWLTGPNTFVPAITIKVEVKTDWAWKLWYNPGDPDDPDDLYANTFFVIVNGAEMADLRWTDGGNQVMHGPDFRRTGGCLNAAGDSPYRGMVPTEYGWFDETGPVPATIA